jgi:L-iditol 2-dehydrogenase
MIVGRHDERLALARQFGVEHLVHARHADVAAAIRELTEMRGADYLIECTGAQDVWESVPSYVRRGGTVSFFGGLPGTARVCFSAARMHYDEVRLISPFHFRPSSVKQAYTLLASGSLDPRPLVSEIVSLAEIERVFERLDAGDGIKFAIEP